MNIPPGEYKSDEAQKVLESVLTYNLDQLSAVVKPYDRKNLIDNWILLLRSIDELINLPFEFEEEADSNRFILTRLDYPDIKQQMGILVKFLEWLKGHFREEVSTRAFKLCVMITAINRSLKSNGFDLEQNGFSLNTVGSSIEYFQSRRVYYHSFLHVINCNSEGAKTIDYRDSLNFFFYNIETLFGGITHSYYNLLQVQCLDNHTITVYEDGIRADSEFKTLESFYLEPQKIGLPTQLNLRENLLGNRKIEDVDLKGKVFSKDEFPTSLSVIYNAFEKYLRDNKEFRIFEKFVIKISKYFKNDYQLFVAKDEFEKILNEYKDLDLVLSDNSITKSINSISPFILISEKYYTNYSRLMRFITKHIYSILFKSKSFQVDSGFVFEDHLKNILEDNGVTVTDVKRIDRKEFDVVALNNGEILNFQCKNNFLNINSVNPDYKQVASKNQRLVKKYLGALEKEEGREELLKKELEKDEISHFVVSRYPVITNNDRIINFVDFEEKLEGLLR